MIGLEIHFGLLFEWQPKTGFNVYLGYIFQVKFVFLSLKMFFVLVNNVDAAFHQGHHCI